MVTILIIALNFTSISFAEDQDDPYLKDSARIEALKRIEIEKFDQQRKLMELRLEIEKNKIKQEKRN